MKRTFVLALGLLFMPALASAQVEIGLDAGLGINKVKDADDTGFSFGIPVSGARIGFAAGESIIVETMLDLGYAKLGDVNATSLDLVPGINYLINDQVYVRGEAGLTYITADDGTGSVSGTQLLFGGGIGMRRMLGDAALLRLEGAVDRRLEKLDQDIPFPASWDIRFVVGVSAVVN